MKKATLLALAAMLTCSTSPKAGTLDVSDEILVTYGYGPSSVGSVAVTGDRFVVAGTCGDESLDGDAGAAFGVAFDNVWNPFSPVFLNEQTAGSQGGGVCRRQAPDGFACVWSSLSLDDGFSDIYGRYFDGDLTPLTGEFLINQSTEGTQMLGDVFSRPDGGLVAVWTSDHTGRSRVFFRVFDENGNALSQEIGVNPEEDLEERLPAVISQPSGDILAAWNGRQARFFDQAGSALGDVFKLGQEGVTAHEKRVRLAVYASGDFVAVWDGGTLGGEGVDGDENDIYVRWFDSDGAPTTDAVMVNHEWVGDQWNPDVAVNSEGLALITWQDGIVQSSPEIVTGTSIYASWWDENGNRLGGDWMANEFNIEQHASPNVALNDESVALIGWESYNLDIWKARAKAFQWIPDEPGDDDAGDDENDDDSANADDDDDDDDDDDGCGC